MSKVVLGATVVVTTVVEVVVGGSVADVGGSVDAGDVLAGSVGSVGSASSSPLQAAAVATSSMALSNPARVFNVGPAVRWRDGRAAIPAWVFRQPGKGSRPRRALVIDAGLGPGVADGRSDVERASGDGHGHTGGWRVPVGRFVELPGRGRTFVREARGPPGAA